MAKARFTKWAAIFEFEDAEITQIINIVSSGGNAVAALAGLFAAFGITAPAAPIAAAVSALLKMGAIFLRGCNSQKKGVFVHVLGYGVPWCRPR